MPPREDIAEEVNKSDFVESVEDSFSESKKENKHKKMQPYHGKDGRFKNSTPIEGEGSIATTMHGPMGRYGRSTLYIIGDYLYCHGKWVSDKVKTRCRNSKQCRRYAYLDPETLKVIKFTGGEHVCIRDPDLKFQIQMENEMKERARASAKGSKASFRKIYDTVCKKNTAVASRITFSRMYKAMDSNWRHANSTL